MDRISQFIARKLVARIVSQPRPREALLRFVYYTEEFVERFDIQPILPHLDDDEREAMLRHFKDEQSHSRALRKYCEKHGLAVERSAAEDALIRRSDEGYAQYLRHLDVHTNRFTPEEMLAYYAHVDVQEDLADNAYTLVADELERQGHHLDLVRILRAFARSEVKHKEYAERFITKYEAVLGSRKVRKVKRRTRRDSAVMGLKFARDFLRLLVTEHGFQAGALRYAL
jgi:hypothetical protein